MTITLKEASRELARRVSFACIAVLAAILAAWWSCIELVRTTWPGLACGMLYEKGYRNMKILDEGIVGWHEKRFPMAGTKVR